MKKLSRISLDAFDPMLEADAAQLFGGEGLPNDSTSVNRTDSVPNQTVKNTVTINSSYNKKTGYTGSTSYSGSYGNWGWTVGTSYNTKNGWSYTVGGSFKF